MDESGNMIIVLRILRVVSWVLLGIVGLYYLWIFFNDIVGLFIEKKKKYPAAKAKKAAVIICARNEESVIGSTLDSLNAQDYPKDLMQVFVVAHNCTDRTEEVAREKGATVLVRNAPEEKTKGDALKYAIRTILDDYPGVFEFFSVLDADNEADPGFLMEMNNALASGADAAQGFYDSKNYYETWVTELSSALWLQTMRCQSMPNSHLGLPVAMLGSGFSFKVSALDKEGWHTETLTEDLEFTIQQVLKGSKLVSAPCAVFYSEQVTKLKQAIVQRKRWAIGNTECFRRYIGRIVKAIPERGMSAFKMMLDTLLYPILFCTVVNLVVQMAIIALTGGTFVQTVQFLAIAAAGSWLMVLPLTLIFLFKEKKNLLDNMCTVVLFPACLFLSLVLSCVSMFKRTTDWVPTVRSSSIKQV